MRPRRSWRAGTPSPGRLRIPAVADGLAAREWEVRWGANPSLAAFTDAFAAAAGRYVPRQHAPMVDSPWLTPRRNRTAAHSPPDTVVASGRDPVDKGAPAHLLPSVPGRLAYFVSSVSGPDGSVSPHHL
jgi:hypothetical protein